MSPPREHLRILHVVHGLPRGGLERGVINLLNGLPRAEFLQGLCCLERRGEMAPQVHAQVEIFELERVRHELKLPLRLARLIRCWQPDVVHCRNWSSWLDTVAASMIAHRFGGLHYPLVWSFHGFDNDPELPLRQRLACRLMNAATDQVFAVCRFSADRFAQIIGVHPNRFRVIHNGVDTQLYRPQADKAALRRKLGLPTAQWIVLTVANLIAVKNHHALMETAAHLPSDIKRRLHWVVVGDGPLRAELELKRDRFGLTEQVILVGMSDRVAEYMAAADVFVMPSVLEGMCNAILEAMATGLPVIANRVGGNPELVVHGSTGILCDAGASGDMIGALTRLLTNEDLRATLGAAGRRRAEQVFPLPRMLANYASYYREVVSTAAARRG